MDICSPNPTDLMTGCIAHMQANGIPYDGCLKADGELHRFSRDSKKNQPDEWYVCYEGISQKGNSYLVCRYGTWSGGQENYTYKSYDFGSGFSQDELIEIRLKEDETKQLFAKQQREDRDRRIKQAQEVWGQSVKEPMHPGHSTYLKNKQVDAFGLRYRVDYDGTPVVVIPLYNIEGELQAIQCIQADGTKKIYGPKKGNFHVIGVIEAESPIFIAEGYATAASIHQSINSPVVVAFDCGNLKSVVSRLREKYPYAKLLIAADDDRETPGNPGKSRAKEAATAYGCTVITPFFPSDLDLSSDKCLTDFNDLYVHYGIDTVADQLRQLQQVEDQKYSELEDSANIEPNLAIPAEGFQFRSAHALTQDPPKANWLIKSYIDACSFMQLFGEPGSMKSFVAIDMGLCVATGIDWHGSPVRKKGPVFYIAGEGFSGLSKRLRAWSLTNNIDLKEVHFFVSDRPAQILDPLNVREVIEAIEDLKKQHGQPVFVIIDTLNRNFGPGDENQTEDMTAFVNCIDADIRLRYGCSVLIVHHSPLNDSGRARGASALRGALDWEYCLTKQKDLRKLTCTKVKDYEPPVDVFFKPRSILLDGWVDEDDGKTMTSCVLEKVDGDFIECKSNAAKLKGPQEVAFNSLLKLYESSGCDKTIGVNIQDWRNAAYKAGISPTGKPEAKQKAFVRAIEKLTALGLIEATNNFYRPLRTPDMDRTLIDHVSGPQDGQTRHES